MNYFNQLRDYVLEKEFKITILKNQVDLVNYTSIGHFDSNKIMIKSENNLIVINGKNLIISKLLTDEVLVTGTIQNIEFR